MPELNISPTNVFMKKFKVPNGNEYRLTGSGFKLIKKKKKRKKRFVIKKLPDYLRDWRKKERLSYIHRMAKINELETNVYIVRLFNETESFYKVGITIDLDSRFKGLPYNYELITSGVFDTIEAWNIETHILQLIYTKSKPYKPKIKMVGSTECFLKSDLKMIQNYLSKKSLYL